MKALQAIINYEKGQIDILKNEKWLLYLALTEEQRVNLERIESMTSLEENYVLAYVKRSLEKLDTLALSEQDYARIESVLKWSETAKGGMTHQRRKWLEDGVDLFAHNIGSAQIYATQGESNDPKEKIIIEALIETHGLIGQFIRGEVLLSSNIPLLRLVESAWLTRHELSNFLLALNNCVISAVSETLWACVSSQVVACIEWIVNGEFCKYHSLKERMRRLRTTAIQNGENFEQSFEMVEQDLLIEATLNKLFENTSFWYVEAALYDFSFDEFLKIMLMVEFETKGHKPNHISFENMMRGLYYQHNGKKHVNLYKKRVVENYLSKLTISSILEGEFKENAHIAHEVLHIDGNQNIAVFDFKLSSAGSRLIDFCVEAEKSGVLYEKAIILLFDLFELRKDAFDRFYEEEQYLQTMNQSVDFKKVILDYIVGESVIDIGPGGGALLDMIEAHYPNKRVAGVDISQNVIDNLNKRKQLESKKWDALNLKPYVIERGVDTIIFCSVLHELFSYIETDGKKFNYTTLERALVSAFEALPPSGRIIIRDGIMTEPTDMQRIIKFRSEEGLVFLKQYAADFKGRDIHYEMMGQNEVKMHVNDAMEFLYTYTWGEQSYVHEINEQFGYFTPTLFKSFVSNLFGEQAHIVEFKHYLQEGYTIALESKIEFMDENYTPVNLPDSTCLIVIEKNL
jgi:cyclopropane fatty-acyl-phospholipid synthase-like methyltransferase